MTYNERMKPARLDELSDGIFAIVMTILVFEIKIPAHLTSLGISNNQLWFELKNLLPYFLSYVLSFALLFTYWRAHHFFNSVYAKNIDSNLTNINALFFMFVSLVPFSSSLLGNFSSNELAIAIFGAHIVIIGMCLYFMRRYVFYSDHIKNPEITPHEITGSTIRIMVPVVFAIIAIPISFYSTTLSLSLFTLAVIFNLFPYSTKLFQRFF